MRSAHARRLSPALVVSLVALFVALAGNASAVVKVVPLAKRALVADNAKRLNGLSAKQLGAASATAAIEVALAQSPAGATARKYGCRARDGEERFTRANRLG